MPYSRVIRPGRGRIWSFVALLALGLGAFASTGATPSIAADAVPGNPSAASADVNALYRLDSGDKVRVTVFGHDDLSGDFEVDGTGGLSLPLIQRVAAKGLTIPQLEKAITDKLQPNYLKDPRVSVEVLNYRPFYILGEVEHPGSYPYVNGMTAVTAVAIAGGYTFRARKDSFKITRAAAPDKQKDDMGGTTPILPGDVIEVPKRLF